MKARVISFVLTPRAPADQRIRFDSVTLPARPAGLDLRGADPPFNIPVPVSLIPFDLNPQVSMGERIIFNSTFNDPNPANFRLRYTAIGAGNFQTKQGAATVTVNGTAFGLASGNVDFYIPTLWIGNPAISVRLDVLDVPAALAVVHTTIWNFARRLSTPTKMTQAETENERALGSVYSYTVSGPKAFVNGVGPYYTGQTILERFGELTCNIELSDLKQSYLGANPQIKKKSDIVTHFWPGGAGDNGTFTIDGNNQVFDGHGGGMPVLATFTAALKFPKEIYQDLPQFYETQAKVVIGKYVIRRILKKDGTFRLRKFAV